MQSTELIEAQEHTEIIRAILAQESRDLQQQLESKENQISSLLEENQQLQTQLKDLDGTRANAYDSLREQNEGHQQELQRARERADDLQQDLDCMQESWNIVIQGFEELCALARSTGQSPQKSEQLGGAKDETANSNNFQIELAESTGFIPSADGHDNS